MVSRVSKALRKIFVTLSDPGSSSAAQIVWHGRVLYGETCERSSKSGGCANLWLIRMRSIVIVAFTVASMCGFVLETDRVFYEMNLGM